MQCRWHQQPTHVRREGHAGTASQVKGRCCSSVILEDAGGCQGCIGYFKIFKACRFWQVLKTDIYIYYLPSGFRKKYDKCWLQAAKFFTLKKIRCRSPARLLGWCCTIVLILWKGCWPQSNDHPYGDDWLAEIVQDDIQKKGKVEMWWWSRKVVNGTCPRESCASIRYLSLPISPIYLFRTTSSGTSSYKSTNEARTKKNNANLSVITAISVVSKSARDDLVLMGWNPALVDIPRHPNTCGLKVFLYVYFFGGPNTLEQQVALDVSG